MSAQSIAAIAALAIGAGSASAQTERDSGEYVSIVQLIAHPDRYDGKVVFLIAYATIRHEGDSLCMVPKAASSKDCVWLRFDDGPYETEQDFVRYDRARAKWQQLSGKLISVRGTFSKTDTGHFGMYSGGIGKISDVYPAPRK